MSEPAAAAPEERFQRQHPLSWVFPALAAVRTTVVPAILFFVFWQGCAFGWLAALFVLPALTLGVVRYLATSYALTSSELIVRDGVLSRNERRVRYARIQNVDEVQGLLHRLLGVIAVRVETASGGEPEAVLTLAPAAVDELRRSIFGQSRQEAPVEPAAPILVVPTGDLVRLGLIKNRGFVVVAAILGLVFQGGSDFFPDSWERVGEWIQRFGSEVAAGERTAPSLDGVTWVAGFALLVLGLVVLLSTLSILLAWIRFGGFTLSREGDDLTARFGLLSRLRVTVPRRRIQRLQVDESLFHRLWRRVSIRLDTAGGATEADDSPLKDSDPTKGRQWLAPVTTRDRLAGLFGEAMPAATLAPLAVEPEAAGGDVSSDGWRPVDPRAARRLFNRTMLLVLAVSFGAAGLSRWALLAPLVGLPLLWWVCHRSVAARRYWPTADALWWRRGWPGRTLLVLPYDKIQSVRLSESPFDRRYRMAKVTVDTAGSGLFPAAEIAYLDAEQAHRLARRLAREAGRREFVWS